MQLYWPIATNCPLHFSPAGRLCRLRLRTRWRETLDRLAELNPGLKVWFTVSPVRHLADGAHANQLSKAHLLLAVEELLTHPSVGGYFPAYEIFMDELRDYRFYASDMVHPSETAIDFLMGEVRISLIESPVLRLWSEVTRITRAMAHRTTGGKGRQPRLPKLCLQRISDLKGKAPYIDMATEENYFRELM